MCKFICNLYENSHCGNNSGTKKRLQKQTSFIMSSGLTSVSDGIVLGHSALCYAKVLHLGDIHPQCIDAFEGLPMNCLLSRQAISL